MIGHAHPPATLEGWYALHQLYSIDRAALRALDRAALESSQASLGAALRSLVTPDDGGWSAVVPLVGSRADVMFMHFRTTLDRVGEAQRRVQDEPLVQRMTPVYSFLSVTEAGLYHITAALAKEAGERGGVVGDEAYLKRLAERAEAERNSPHLRKRLYPEIPAGMPYVCFYPMSKRRNEGENWYRLTLEERSRLMQAHGQTGRRYAGRIMQIVTGAIGLDAWEWGVTLFGTDPLEFKKIVTEMRFDEVTARYGEFGEFFVGRLAEPEEWVAWVGK